MNVQTQMLGATIASLFNLLHVGNLKAQERYAWLSDGFKERFGSTPTLFARAPGKCTAETA